MPSRKKPNTNAFGTYLRNVQSVLPEASGLFAMKNSQKVVSPIASSILAHLVLESPPVSELVSWGAEQGYSLDQILSGLDMLMRLGLIEKQDSKGQTLFKQTLAGHALLSQTEE